MVKMSYPRIPRMVTDVTDLTDETDAKMSYPRIPRMLIQNMQGGFDICWTCGDARGLLVFFTNN